MSFKQDLAVGEAVEQEFVEFLKKQGLKAGLNSSKTVAEKRFYDIYADNGLTYEVKFDRRVTDTGNIYLEHDGLGHSRADIIVYKLDVDGKFYFMGREQVLEILKDKRFKQVSGGDKWGKGTLIPLNEFRKLFIDYHGKAEREEEKKKVKSKKIIS